MNSIEKRQEPFKSEKWLYYQDVKSTNIYVKPTKKDVEEFREFINDKIKKDTKKQLKS